jgi:hypothetical protein
VWFGSDSVGVLAVRIGIGGVVTVEVTDWFLGSGGVALLLLLLELLLFHHFCGNLLLDFSEVCSNVGHEMYSEYLRECLVSD